MNQTMVEYIESSQDRAGHTNPRSIQAEYDARIGKHKADIEAVAQKIISESGGEDVLKASAAERIKKLESIKPQRPRRRRFQLVLLPSQRACRSIRAS